MGRRRNAHNEGITNEEMTMEGANLIFKIDDGRGMLSFEGRLDTTATTHVQQELDQVFKNAASIAELTWDASGMTYISSSGLRIMLMLRKRFPSFKVTNVCPDVYSVFEMTGFTKMMPVERGLRQMSVEGCEEIGRGGVGVVYRVSDDTIIKVFREGTGMADVSNEIVMAKEAFLLGMPTAISFDMVQVGRQYGLVYELLRAHTLSQCLKAHPDQVDHYARLYAGLFRQLHSIEVPANGVIPNAHENDERSINHIRRYFDDKSVDMLLQVHRAIPQDKRLLHCDLQSKNAMVQGDELMLIDMGEVGYGHPLLDLSHAHSAMVGLVGDYEATVGIPRELGVRLWEKMLGYYFEGTDEATFAHRLEQIEVASYVRNFSWLSLSDSFPAAVVDECRRVFQERVVGQYDRILAVSKTFSDWTL